MAASEPSGSTGAQPSAEAVRAYDLHGLGRALDVAHAEGVQEGRAAERAEIAEWLRRIAVERLRQVVGDAEAGRLAQLADAIEARFPSEGTT